MKQLTTYVTINSFSTESIYGLKAMFTVILLFWLVRSRLLFLSFNTYICRYDGSAPIGAFNLPMH